MFDMIQRNVVVPQGSVIGAFAISYIHEEYTRNWTFATFANNTVFLEVGNDCVEANKK